MVKSWDSPFEGGRGMLYLRYLHKPNIGFIPLIDEANLAYYFLISGQ